MDSIVTVTSAATNRRLTTLARVKSELAITGNGDNEALETKIDEASEAIESYLGRRLARETVSEVFRLHCSVLWLQLDRWPVTTLTSITEDTTVLTVSTDYEVDFDAGRVRRICSGYATWWTAYPSTTVVYVAGYVLPGDAGTRTLPYDIEAAAVKLVTGSWLAKTRDPMVKRQDHFGVGYEEYWVNIDAANLPAEVRALLDPHRPPNV